MSASSTFSFLSWTCLTNAPIPRPLRVYGCVVKAKLDRKVCLDIAKKEPLGVIALGPRLLALKKSSVDARSYNLMSSAGFAAKITTFK